MGLSVHGLIKLSGHYDGAIMAFWREIWTTWCSSGWAKNRHERAYIDIDGANRRYNCKLRYFSLVICNLLRAELSPCKFGLLNYSNGKFWTTLNFVVSKTDWNSVDNWLKWR